MSAKDFTAPSLLALLRYYYPPHLYSDEEGYRTSEEHQRLLAARKSALASVDSWRRLLARLAQALPDCKVEDWSVFHFSDDNCWRVRVYLPEPQQQPGVEELRSVVVLVSILAPVYAIYSSFQQRHEDEYLPSRLSFEQVPETQPYADKVEELVRAELQAERLPNEVLFTPAPDIQCGNVLLGKARLIDCLFTDDLW